MKKIIIGFIFLFFLVSNSYAKDDWVQYKNRAKAYYSAHIYSRAIEEYTKAIQAAPDEGSYLYGLYLFRGQSYAFDKLYEQAIADFTTAIGINPYDVAAYAERGNTYALKGWYEQGLFDLGRALAMKPDDGLSYLYRAQAYYNAKDYKKAWGDLKQASIYGQQVPDRVMKDYEKKALGREIKRKDQIKLF